MNPMQIFYQERSRCCTIGPTVGWECRSILSILIHATSRGGREELLDATKNASSPERALLQANVALQHFVLIR